jgi:hypothetical protein
MESSKQFINILTTFMKGGKIGFVNEEKIG